MKYLRGLNQILRVVLLICSISSMLFRVKSFSSNTNQTYLNEIEKICEILLNLFFHVSKLALRFKILCAKAPHKKV